MEEKRGAAELPKPEVEEKRGAADEDKRDGAADNEELAREADGVVLGTLMEDDGLIVIADHSLNAPEDVDVV